MRSQLTEGSEVKQALAKAEECAEKAALAKTAEDRDYYDRMRRKWLGIAEGWRVIDEVDKVSFGRGFLLRRHRARAPTT